MSAILPKCYQSQGQPFLLSFRSSKNLETRKKSATAWSKRSLRSTNDRKANGANGQCYRTLTAPIRTPFVKLLSTVIIGSLGLKAVLGI